ncbi:FAD:protein FMN transferase [Pedobacter sp. JY14-1]|uniref:FAD:protein FMN transferase n=1 Tax=Pedobacter sp. JY14-1 TaxID=3034151 RepID=UPI0023E0B13A|nr:FAD:protein FMN transferase [Pedobacter sp. JY14-1]
MALRNLLLLLVSLPLLFSFTREEQRQYTIHGYAQGTDYTIKYFAADNVVTKAQIDSILGVIDASMSLYKPVSLISRFNASEKGLKLDMHFEKVIRKSFEVNRETRGIFDVTVKPLVQAWGFGVRPAGSFPDSVQIRSLLGCVGMNNLKLQGGMLKKQKPCIQVDLNGIAQGYSVDVVAGFLDQRKLKAYVVEIGGELKIRGPKPDGSAFRIGVEGPADRPDAGPLLKHTIVLNNGAVTTSGNYRKFLQLGNSRISHLIDPKTGYPLQSTMISVTLYAQDAITADGYDNALMAMNVDQALAFVNARKGMEAYLIYHNEKGQVADTMTTGFRQLIADVPAR